MFCKSCGSRIEEGMKFCRICGSPVINAATSGANTSIETLLERAFIFLEDGKWWDANIYCEKALDIDPKNAQAYLGKLMAELQVRNREQLANCATPFNGRDNYAKIIRYGDEKLVTELRGYIDFIKKRNETARLTGIYNSAIAAMNTANTESEYKSVAARFQTLSGFKDAETLADQCLYRAEECRKENIYAAARNEQTNDNIDYCKHAIMLFESIPGFKDADEQIERCNKKIEELTIKAKKVAKIRKKIIIILTVVIAALAAFCILFYTVIIPNIRYNAAVDYYNAKKYDEAIKVFTALNGYKDSKEQIKKCENAILETKYKTALELYNAGKYEEALEGFYELDGYKDSKEKAESIIGVYSKCVYTYSNGDVSTIEYTYDDKGNLTKEVSTYSIGGSGTTQYTYDDKGNMIKEEYAYPPGRYYYTAQYTYDSNGNLIKGAWRYSDGYSSTVTYTNNSKGDMIKGIWSYSDGTSSTVDYKYNYDDQGRIIKMVETTSDGDVKTTEYTYDNKWNKVIKEVRTDSSGEKSKYEYTYDNKGNEIKVLHTYSDGDTVTFEYSGYRYFLNPNKDKIIER